MSNFPVISHIMYAVGIHSNTSQVTLCFADDREPIELPREDVKNACIPVASWGVMAAKCQDQDDLDGDYFSKSDQAERLADEFMWNSPDEPNRQTLIEWTDDDGEDHCYALGEDFFYNFVDDWA